MVESCNGGEGLWYVQSELTMADTIETFLALPATERSLAKRQAGAQDAGTATGL
jgi:hypothetical protein